MSQRKTPQQDTRERVFVLLTYLRDDNGDPVEGTDKVIAGTTSGKVGREVLETFKKRRNGQATMVNDGHADRYLGQDPEGGPTLLEKILDPEAHVEMPKAPAKGEPEAVTIDSLLEMVDLGSK